MPTRKERPARVGTEASRFKKALGDVLAAPKQAVEAALAKEKKARAKAPGRKPGRRAKPAGPRDSA